MIASPIHAVALDGDTETRGLLVRARSFGAALRAGRVVALLARWRGRDAVFVQNLVDGLHAATFPNHSALALSYS